mmetsp:Transcript_44187/g.69131  ORF Transcript_44187/g.69131 Transcript_44187/m.69131 type:complete len:336 (-) Transcript_44187:28-1035(-)
MLSESFPPSTPTPSSMSAALMAWQASYSLGPSPGSLAAHIQLAEHLTSPRAVTLAHMRLVTISATVQRAMAAGHTRPLMGCSPTAVATPAVSKWLWASTAQLASGTCSGPTHCCCATRPVTERSTLLVRNRLEPTETSRSTRSSAAAHVRPSGSASGAVGSATRCMSKVFCGILPSTRESGRSKGVVPSRASCTTTRPSAVTRPTKDTGHFSRAAMASSSSRSSGRTSRPLFSWYSAPQSSFTLRVASPALMSRSSYRAPSGSTISLSTLPLPPAPWSCTETIGLRAPSSTQARISRFILFSISASPRCTALKSSAASWSPESTEEAAPPPMPMR